MQQLRVSEETTMSKNPNKQTIGAAEIAEIAEIAGIEAAEKQDSPSTAAREYLKSLKLDEHQIENLTAEYFNKFPLSNKKTFNLSLIALREIKPFAAAGNVFETGQTMTEEMLFLMRWIAGIKMTEIFEVLKFDLSDSNMKQDLSVGNIGTPQRWAKTVTGASLEDDSEMMSGRYIKKPRLATFENENRNGVCRAPITKRVDITSVCSHHLLAYGTPLSADSYAVISYIPDNYVLGISKLQRLANWVSKRPTIQEDLVKALWDNVADAAGTNNVYVGIFNAKHTCEYLRGSCSQDGAFTSEYYEGAFEDNNVRQQVYNSRD